MKRINICIAIWISIIVVVQHTKQVESVVGVFNFVREIIRSNIAGIPVAHQQSTFDFDPEVSVKRRDQYYDVHGYRGEKVIERVGLGIDGNHKERKQIQAIRDSGRLQGANYQKEYSLLAGRNYS